MGNYEVNSKVLSTAISKCLSVIALGDKAESNSITLEFHKKGLAVEAHNSVAAYRTDIAVDIIKPAKIRVHVLPELLLAYSNAHSKLTLIPSEEYLTVKGGKNFSANMYIVGNNDGFEQVKPEDATDISSIALASAQSLSIAAGIRNRTDQQILGVNLEWSKGILELTIGDTHHAVIIDQEIKQKGSGKIIMTLPNLQKIMSVGKNFTSDESRIYAWSDDEYLSIMSQSDNIFLSNAARDLIRSSKRQTKVVVDTETFRNTIETMVTAVDESSPINFKITAKGILANVKTGASDAKGSIKLKKFAGKPLEVGVSIHHLKDCLSTAKEKELTISVFSNMVSFESSNKKVKTIAAMSSVGVK